MCLMGLQVGRLASQWSLKASYWHNSICQIIFHKLTCVYNKMQVYDWQFPSSTPLLLKHVSWAADPCSQIILRDDIAFFLHEI